MKCWSKCPLIMLLFLSNCIFLASVGATGSRAASYRVIGYFAQWGIYERDYEPADIPAAKLTHINYAFAEVRDTGEIYSIDTYADFQMVFPAKNGLPAQTWEESENLQAGNFGRLRDLKALYPHLKVLLALGGWGWDGTFSGVAADPAKRATFAASCASWVEAQGLDGIDIDWEYPAASDRENVTALLQAVRAELDSLGSKNGRQYYLSVATPSSEANLVGFDIPTVVTVVDWINLMTYDYHGSWDYTTGFNAPLYGDPADPSSTWDIFNVSYTVDLYLTMGVPASQLNLGLPLYGRSWEAVADTNHGLYQSGQPGPNTGADGNWETGMFDYWRVVQLSQDGQYTRYWSGSSRVPYLYGPNISSGLSGGMFLSYDDTQSVGEKVDYLKSKGLGGAMFWELSGDIRDSSDPNSLVGLVSKNLADATAPLLPGVLLLLLFD